MRLRDTPFMRGGWGWVPGVYFAEGLPFATATIVSAVMFKSLGMDNGSNTFWTSMIALPWSVKFLWAPFIDMHGTKRAWMLAMQFAMAFLFIVPGIFLLTGMPFPLRASVMLFMATAVLSATHDVAADGYYMLALDGHGQAVCSGLRNIFYKCATLCAQGGLVMFAGRLISKGCPAWSAWALAMTAAGGLLFVLFLYHAAAAPDELKQARNTEHEVSGETDAAPSFVDSFMSFFRRRGAAAGILFLLFYRFAESQLGKVSPIFLIAPASENGLSMTLEEQGFVYGTVGVICFLGGSLLAGALVGKYGFGKCLWPMAAALNIPDVFYLAMAVFRPGLAVSGSLIALEQFGYGIGYMAHVLFMVQFAAGSGKYKTTHFALMTGVTVLGMTLTGMFSGNIQTRLAALGTDSWLPSVMSGGYAPFFLWVCVCTIPSFIVTALAVKHVDSGFGKKEASSR